MNQSATSVLREEHKGISIGLKLLARLTQDLEAADGEGIAQLEQLMDFFAGFADRCHHQKEEKILFPMLEREGMLKEGGSIRVMLDEHEAGRKRIREILEGIGDFKKQKDGAVGRIKRGTLAYAEILDKHIKREDEVLFEIADQLLSMSQQRKMVDEFETMEREVIGRGKHKEYHRLLEKLEREIFPAR